jgi:hypothetical protein
MKYDVEIARVSSSEKQNHGNLLFWATRRTSVSNSSSSIIRMYGTLPVQMYDLSTRKSSGMSCLINVIQMKACVTFECPLTIKVLYAAPPPMVEKNSHRTSTNSDRYGASI